MGKILIIGATRNLGGELIKIFSREAIAGAAVSDFAKDANRFSADIESREIDCYCEINRTEYSLVKNTID